MPNAVELWVEIRARDSNDQRELAQELRSRGLHVRLMSAVIYERKSSMTDGEDEASQVENACALATAKGWTVLEKQIYKDDAT